MPDDFIYLGRIQPDDLRRAGRLAEVDEQLVEHAIGCNEKFCQNLKRALAYIHDQSGIVRQWNAGHDDIGV